MQRGDAAILRASNEPVLVLAILDAAGTLLVRCGDEEFEVPRADVMTPLERVKDCGCCP